MAGTGTFGYSGDGGPATEARLRGPRSIAVDASGNIYVGDTESHCIRKVNPSGIITTVAGTGTFGYSGDGGPAVQARLRNPWGIGVDASGKLYFVDGANHCVRKVAYPAAFAAHVIGGDIPFSEETGIGHITSSAGHHKKTIDLNTGVTFNEFGYDQNNNLVSIIDRFGSQTVINKDSNGVSISITSPDGIATALTIDGSNHLTQITYPDGSFYAFEYTPDGLLTAKVEPEGNRFEHVFDVFGKLTDAMDEEGGNWNYTRSALADDDIRTEVLSSEGNLTTYLDRTDSTDAYTSTITDPTGAVALYYQSADGLTVNKSLSCGMDLHFEYGIGLGVQVQVCKGNDGENTPLGLAKTTSRGKNLPGHRFRRRCPDLVTETVTVNGKVTTLENNVPQARKTATSPVGRTVTTDYDPQTLLTTRLAIPGLLDTTYGYNNRGRLTEIATGSRTTTFTYDSQGNLDSITDPENHTTTYTYDAVGRMTGINRPDGSSVGFSYDNNGNMTVLTNPASIPHGFGYNKVNLNSSYQTPVSGSYSYVYDRDRRLTQVNFPSGKQIENIYANGALEQIQTPEGNIDLTYLCGNKVDTITKGTETISYGYDGALVSAENLSGTLTDGLSYGYDDDFNLTSFTYAGATISYSYDNDGLFTGAGLFDHWHEQLLETDCPSLLSDGALKSEPHLQRLW